MKKAPLLYVFALICLVLTSCDRGDHFISDAAYRKKVREKFHQQKAFANTRSEQLFSVFDQDLTLREKEALEFLYAYMSLNDLADYDGEFFLKNVRASLAARDTFSWGKSVPEALFRHFVLPVRINNENLDSSRWVFFEDLKDRIKRLPMKEAVLEVNHWCHEKVTYRGTDGRTSAPLATEMTAFGRCGEESTFTTAALRSVGIPARQVYTPRWAHTDDNHAWVEVWVDGEWHYIGACEPEPALDMAWFTNHARRAMLVNTTVFGDYQGPEEILEKGSSFTRINTLPTYTKTKKLIVRVVDLQLRPVDSAIVEFQLYNYAEFYPLHRIITKKDGLAEFTTGMGDLLVWAAGKDRFGFEKVSVPASDTVTIMLAETPATVKNLELDLMPPPEQTTDVVVDDSLKAINTKRLAFEDQLRASYESTFIDSAKAWRLAATLKLNSDTLWHFLKASRGNWRGIIDFLTGASPVNKKWIFPLLANVSEKDLRDINPEVLADQLEHSFIYPPLTSDQQIIRACVLNPRVDNEWLKPYKGYFQKQLAPALVAKFRDNPLLVAGWISDHIKVDPVANYGRAPLTPIGSFEMKITDAHSRDILLVALCRSFGIPARLEPGSRTPQYFFKDTWKDFFPPAQSPSMNERGRVTLTVDPLNDRKPGYYTHFTIEHFTDGFYRSLDYETDSRLQIFPCELDVAPGNYLLVTGNRLNDGKVLASLLFFQLEPGKNQEVSVSLRKRPAEAPSLGQFDLPGSMAQIIEGNPLKIKGNTGTIVACADPGKEPTRHLIAELKTLKDRLSSSGINLVFLLQSRQQVHDFQQKNAADLPRQTLYAVGTPEGCELLAKAAGHPGKHELPVVLYIDSEKVIRYFSSGYRIGIGDALVSLVF